jgi:CRP/FNR family cyclic AMP-dependent transcriptional regulator
MVAHMVLMKTLSAKPAKKPPSKPEGFLVNTGVVKTILELRSGQTLFCQGERADAVHYLQRGKVKLAVISKRGKEATIALLNSGCFLGEECIAGLEHRKTTAVALTPATVFKIDRKEMIRGLREEQLFCETFISFMIARSARMQDDLIDQLFNSSEKRLARALLLLAQVGKDGAPETVIPRISQETLAEMVGTTRSRVSFFMNRFRKQGFIEYNGKISVHRSLLNVILHD